MTQESMGIKLAVTEVHGMRRYLYPLRVKIPAVYRRSVGKLALADTNGNLIPSHVAHCDDGVQCAFALSLAPYETATLQLVRQENLSAVPIPDPLHVRPTGAGYAVSQERVSFAIDHFGSLSSVNYDGVEHLKNSLEITLDETRFTADHKHRPMREQLPYTDLYAVFSQTGLHDDGFPKPVNAMTSVGLTACKSWATVRHSLRHVPKNATLRFSLGLNVTSDIQTCDFGIGNGTYAKIHAGTIDAVIWENALIGSSGPVKWVIASQLPGGSTRVDYTGDIKARKDAASQFWMHWNEPTKALAVAVTEMAAGCERLMISFDASGRCDVEFAWTDKIADPATFGVCYHFLNAIPPIAAATNPASILLPPKVSIEKS